MSPRQPASTSRKPYHHGDLQRALVQAALELIEEGGPGEVTLRELARRVGVSHAASTHHFGDKAGLLTAVATEGYELLAAALRDRWERTHSFLEVGVAYMHFAVTHRAHFEVMFRPELLRTDDPALQAARAASSALLYGPAKAAIDAPTLEAGVAGWALMHGLAWLWLNDLLPREVGDDPEVLSRAIGSYLFATDQRSSRAGRHRSTN